MPTPATKLNVMIAVPCYGGNGGISSEVPEVRDWLVETVMKAKADPRVGEISVFNIADTPITMSRCKMVVEARRRNAHVLVMIDSDMNPHLYRHESWYKPFWDVAFDELYEHYGRGPLVLGAPYAGPPPISNVYVFYWETHTANIGRETKFGLEQYTRQMAAQMRGVQACAALPTGLIMYDMRAFELIEPSKLNRRAILEQFKQGQLTMTQALSALDEGWFRYEWTDNTACEKASTEDVQNTRDISLAGVEKLGYNPLRCCWDSWAGHWKPWCVGKPELYDVLSVSAHLREIVTENHDSRVGLVDLSTHHQDLIGKAVDFADAAGADVAKELLAGHKTPESHSDSLVELGKWMEYDGKPVCKIAEIGCFTGETTVKLAKAFPRAIITAVDHFKGSDTDHTGDLVKLAGGSEALYQAFCDRIKEEGVAGHVSIDKLKSTEAAKFTRDKSHDIVFIDADHSYEAVLADIKAWRSKVRDGGYLCGHDIGTSQFPGVAKAVREVFGDKAKLIYFNEQGGVWAYNEHGRYPEWAADIPAEWANG